jgi:hypothetical protein
MQQPCKPGPSAIRSILPLSVAVFVWLLLPCNSIISNADGLLTAAFTTSTGDRVQRGEEMFRTWMIAGIALAASTGPTLGQDAAAGEQVFKRLCSPCHEIGQDAKIKLGPPLNGIDGRKSGTFEGFTTPQPINLPASPGARKLFPNISARRCKKCRAPAWHLSASKTTRTSPSSGPISSSSGLMGRRNETRRVGEKAREPLGVSAQRLVSRQCWVDWPAQPYLKPAQTI